LATPQPNQKQLPILFVTVKAVEYHLGNTYSKLGIRRRGQLSGRLGPELAVAAVRSDARDST
jgi:hypothetical protein